MARVPVHHFALRLVPRPTQATTLGGVFLIGLLGVSLVYSQATNAEKLQTTPQASLPNAAQLQGHSKVAIEDGFESIFNGRDLTGWAGPIDHFEIVDGTIRCKEGTGGTIFTKRRYADFVVRLEFKLSPGGNNGLAIRYPGQGDTAYVGMCELQVLDNDHPRFNGDDKLDDRQYHGSAYGIVAAKRGFLKPTGEWNQQEVTVVGAKIKVALNGETILDCDLSEVTEYLDGKDHPGKNRTAGHFGLAGHHDPVAFRNLRIKKLKQTNE